MIRTTKFTQRPTSIVRSLFCLFLLLILCFNLPTSYALSGNDKAATSTEILKLIKETENIRRTDYPMFYKNIEKLKQLDYQLSPLQKEKLLFFQSYKMSLNGDVKQSLKALEKLALSKNINMRLRSYVSQISILTQLKRLNDAVITIDKVLTEIEINDVSISPSLKAEGIQVIGYFYQAIGEYRLAENYYEQISDYISPKEKCLLGFLKSTNKLSAGFIMADDEGLSHAQHFCYEISDLMMANGLTLAKARQLTKEKKYNESIRLLNDYSNYIFSANYALHLVSYNLLMMENYLSLGSLNEAEKFSRKINSTKILNTVKPQLNQLLSKLKYQQKNYFEAHQYLELVYLNNIKTSNQLLKNQLARSQVKHQVAERSTRLTNLINQSKKTVESVNELTSENKKLLDTLIFDKVVIITLCLTIIFCYLIIFYLRTIKQGIINRQRTDPLTGVYMRREFTDLLANMVYKSKFANQPVSVISFNFDHLKKLNKEFGVDEIDYALKQVIQFILQITSIEDKVARIGSDEFAIALQNKTMESAEVTAYRIVNHIQTIHSANTGKVFGLSATFGIADTTISNYVPKALLSDSSKALIKIKNSETKVCLYNSDMKYKKQLSTSPHLRYSFKSK